MTRGNNMKNVRSLMETIKTTYTFEHDGCIILVRNVPCIECEMCGEIFFKGGKYIWRIYSKKQ